MTYQAHGNAPTRSQLSAANHLDDASENHGCYRLVALQATQAPEGCTGSDWFVYRIARGREIITGYRQGAHRNVDEEVQMLVEGLNLRRHISYGKPIVGARRRRDPIRNVEQRQPESPA